MNYEYDQEAPVKSAVDSESAWDEDVKMMAEAFYVLKSEIERLNEAANEIERLREHSRMLNQIGWKIGKALGEVTDEDEGFRGDIMELVDRLISRVIESEVRTPMPQYSFVRNATKEEINDLFEEAERDFYRQHYKENVM